MKRCADIRQDGIIKFSGGARDIFKIIVGLIIILKKYEGKIIKKIKEKGKGSYMVKYSNGYYSAYMKLSSGSVTSSFRMVKLEIAIRELNTYRRDLILGWIEDMKEERINKEIRNL